MSASQPFDDLYRRAAPGLLARLIARFHHFERAEDALAEAFAKAAEAWSTHGWPEQPEAWLLRTAINHDLDQIKHRRVTERFEAALSAHEGDRFVVDPVAEAADRLALFFLCAHPSLSPDTQAMLMLRYCALVSPAGIARAFQIDADSLTRRLGRAKQKLETAGVAFALPPPSTWPERLPPLLAALEVLYDQSYADLSGGIEVEALARDALQLVHQLLELIPDQAELWGLASLLCFAESRRPARLNAEGLMIPLHEQDPQRWNRRLIHRAARYLLRAATLRHPGPYQWRASISAAYARRLELGQTPWVDLLNAYAALAAIDDSAILQINWALAEAHAGQIDAAWTRLQTLNHNAHQNLQPYWLARAELYWLRQEGPAAVTDLQRALSFAQGRAEARFLEAKLAKWRAALLA